jgi:hypothetical protein
MILGGMANQVGGRASFVRADEALLIAHKKLHLT